MSRMSFYLLRKVFKRAKYWVNPILKSREEPGEFHLLMKEPFRSPPAVFQDVSGPRWEKNHTVKSAFSVYVRWPWIVKRPLKESWLMQKQTQTIKPFPKIINERRSFLSIFSFSTFKNKDDLMLSWSHRVCVVCVCVPAPDLDVLPGPVQGRLVCGEIGGLSSCLWFQ